MFSRTSPIRSAGFVIGFGAIASWAVTGLAFYLAYVCITNPTSVGNWAGSIVHGYHDAATN